MTAFQFYRQADSLFARKEISWPDDAIVLTQHTSSYAPDLDLHAYVSDLGATEVVTGLGYAAGGITLQGRSVAYVPAASWARSWAPVTAYQAGQVVKPVNGNGFLYRALTAGSSGGSAPAWPLAYGLTIMDGTVTWECLAAGATTLAVAPAQWLSYAGTYRYLVISDRTPVSASQQPLIGIHDSGSDSTGSGGNFDVTFDPAGVFIRWAL